MKTSILKDIIGNDYIGIKVNINEHNCNGNRLCDVLRIAHDKINDFEICNEKLLDRNHGFYHITLFNVMECNKNKELLKLESINIESKDFEYDGIGSIEKDRELTYFVVLKCAKLQELNPDRDLHITIGFTKKDIFGQPKRLANIIKL